MQSPNLENPHLSTPYTKGEPLLQVKISQFSYDKPVLRDINFIEYDVLRLNYITGQTIAILGRSGRGKSTLFRLLSGLESSPNSEIILNVGGKPEFVHEGMVGMIDQKYTLFRHKTIKQTLKFAANRNKKLDQSSIDEYIKEVCHYWDILGNLDKYPHECSGGQRQRAAILEKLLLGNHYLILDEPISGLDVVAIQTVKDNMNRIVSEHEHNTLIFSTHDIGFAYEMADSIYILGIEPNKQGSTIVKSFDRRFGSSYTYEDVRTAVFYS